MLDQQKLESLIKQAPNENDHWDFKEQWYESNERSELLRDIINFVNTPHHDDCYIIIGVEDKHGEIVGVDEDTNRFNRQKLQDFLRSKPFAQNFYPNTDVNTFSVYSPDKKKDVEIDVITIFNENKTPIFLQQKVRGIRYKADDGQVHTQKDLLPGLIYSRINDSNTPVNESTSDHQMELLWRKRFGLDLDLYTKYKLILRSPKKWEHIVTKDNQETYIYIEDPNFVIKSQGHLDNRNSHFESFVMSEYDIRIEWFGLTLFYGNNVVYEAFSVLVNKTAFELVVPDNSYINFKDNNTTISYPYYLKDDFPYLITQCINNCRDKKHFTSIPDYVYADVVFYKNKNEKKYYELLAKENLLPEEILVPTKDEIARLMDRIKWSETNGVYGDIELIAKKMMSEHLLVKYIKKLQNKHTNLVLDHESMGS